MATRDEQWPDSPEGKPYTFEPNPLGMSSPTDSFAFPYQEGHMLPEAALNPLAFYQSQPDVYSDSPLEYYQWWHNVSEWRKGSGGPPVVAP